MIFDVERINIVKILNLPIENNEKAEIDISLQLDSSKNTHRIKSDDIGNSEVIKSLEQQGKIKAQKVYNCESLFVIDERGNKYTLYGFSYVYNYMAFDYYIDFVYNAKLYFEHLDNLKRQIVEQAEIEVEYPKYLKLDFTCDNIHIIAQPQYTKDEPTQEEFERIGLDYRGIFNRRIKFNFIGQKSFEELELTMFRLSEFLFLCYEDMFFYDMITLNINGKSYRLDYYLRANNQDKRKRNLRTSDSKSNVFCAQLANNFGEHFENFLKFRSDSGFIFDVFRTTVHSITFIEDYPLRLSQTMEGLANYLGIADTTKKDPTKAGTFVVAIQLSLHCNDYIKDYLPTFQEIQLFSRKITEHRNKFSHVNIKKNKQYLKGEDNAKYSEILYTTIRVLITKRIQGLI